MARTRNSFTTSNQLVVRQRHIAIMGAWLLATSVASGQPTVTNNVITNFIAAPPKSGRGPSRSVFEPTAAQLLCHEILEDDNSELRQLLKMDEIEGLARSVSRVSNDRRNTGKVQDGLASLDQLDEPYERILADRFNEAGRERLAMEFLRIDGLSAIRRPLVARALKFDEMTRNRAREAVSPAWESAISLNRAIFDGAAATKVERQQITDGLEILSKEADHAVLEILTDEQVNRLGELITRFPIKPERSLKAN